MKRYIIMLMLMASVAFADNAVFSDGTNLFTKASGTYTNLGVDVSTLDTQYCKYHNTNSVTFTSANVWSNMVFNFTPPNENSHGFALSTNTITVDFDGLIEINGCARSYWTGGDNTEASLASRIVYSGDNWVTTNEARCLQAYWSRERKADDYQTAPYGGSLYVTNTLQIRLQVQVSNTSMRLEQAPLFDNPLSVTFNAWCIGK